MRKILAVGVVVMLLLSLGTNFALAAKPGTDFNGPHYNLNIIGKKADWSGGGSYDNANRHTIFVPEDTTGYTCPNNDPETDLPGVAIWMTRGTEFAVIDGNAFDDGECRFQLGPGKYAVYIVAKAKPGFETDITGWIQYKDPLTGEDYLYLKVGELKVTGKQWQDGTDLLWVSTAEDTLGLIADDTYVFDYLDLMGTAGYADMAYFWQYDNHGNKLVKVRFYEI